MKDEILAHISAPATRQSDELYRSLANAYVAFEPLRSLRNDSTGAPDQSRSSATLLKPFATPLENNSFQPVIDISILSTSKDSYGSFPSYLSSEIHDNNDDQQPDSQPFSGSFGNDSVPTSSRLAQLDRVHMNWKGKATSKPNIVSENQQNSHYIQDLDDDLDTAFIEDTQLAAQALQSQLPDNYSMTSEHTSDDESRHNEPSQHSEALEALHERHCLGTRSVEMSYIRSQVTTGIEESAIEFSEGSHLVGTSSFSASSNIFHSPMQEHLSVEAAISPPLDFRGLPIDAYPPAPTISIVRPGILPSQVTKHLAALKIQNPKRFKPATKVRTPKADDRGYWSVECSKWPRKSQHEFWLSMLEHIQSGRLGWGTTLHRESKSPQALGHVRLYCWGELVEHMWLLLWLCSDGKIVGCGSRWNDADGNVVYVVA